MYNTDAVAPWVQDSIRFIIFITGLAGGIKDVSGFET